MAKDRKSAPHLRSPVLLSVPARFRLVIEGPLEHQVDVLDCLRAVASKTGCLVIARAEPASEAEVDVADDDMGDLLGDLA